MTTKKSSKTRRVAVAMGILVAFAVLGMTTAEATYYGAGCNPDECHTHGPVAQKVPILVPACGPDPDAAIGAGCNVG